MVTPAPVPAATATDTPLAAAAASLDVRIVARVAESPEAGRPHRTVTSPVTSPPVVVSRTTVGRVHMCSIIAGEVGGGGAAPAPAAAAAAAMNGASEEASAASADGSTVAFIATKAAMRR